jgi:triacylglycerol lipase
MSTEETILWLLILVIAFIIFYFILTSLIRRFIVYWFFRQFQLSFEEYCANLEPITYEGFILRPTQPQQYDYRLAKSLFSIANNTTRANCSGVILPPPPGYRQAKEIIGINPITKQSNTFGYIFFAPERRQAIISFVGSQLLSEWILDFDFRQTAPVDISNYQSGMLVHEGFWKIYESVRSDLWTWWTDNNSEVNELFITGHSLGGAVSTLCAFDFAVFQPLHYSFASPRVGNILFSDIYNQNITTSFRVNNTEDLIPQVPLANLLNITYQHVGQNVPFTLTLPSLAAIHTLSYRLFIPECPEVAGCYLEI